jgi:hypothetical protein
MRRFSPPIRVGMLCAVLHQALGALTLASLFWTGEPSRAMQIFFLIADAPALFLASELGLSDSLGRFNFPGLPTAVRPFVDHQDGSILAALTLGAMQWFLIGSWAAYSWIMSEPRAEAEELAQHSLSDRR